MCVAALSVESQSSKLICGKLRTRWTFSQAVMVSVGISKVALKDLIFVLPKMKINNGYYRDMLLSQVTTAVARDARRVRRFLHLSTRHVAHLHTWHATRCDCFLSSQHPLSFLQISSRLIAPTLIHSITKYGVTFSSEQSECISRSYTQH